VLMNEHDFEQAWKAALLKLESLFLQPFDLQGALFLIGLNELGQGPRRFNKDQKLDVMHLAVCRLLQPYGYYEFEGVDQDGWPHYRRTDRLPKLEPEEQEKLMKEAILSYTQESLPSLM
jgi:hypothetical protein